MNSSPRSILPAKPRRSGPSIEVLEQRIAPATFTVTNTADSGAGSLRAAILNANAASGPDLIDFAIGDGTGPFVIHPLSALPAITDLVTIDGYTQAGASQNTASEGTNAVLRIVLDGSMAGGVDGLVLSAGSEKSKITGLAIVDFEKSGLQLESNDITVVGNFIGVDPDGVTARGNRAAGVLIGSGAGYGIGKNTLADRNLISGNGSAGVLLLASSASITGNLIGTNASGSGALGNLAHGVALTTGTATVANNVISGNVQNGIHLSGAVGATLRDNLIGLDASGEFALGNLGSGIVLRDGTTLTNVVGNTIGDNGADGVTINGLGDNTNTLKSNVIGTNIFGDSMPNDRHGVSISGGAKFNRIGGNADDGNLIANHQATLASGDPAAGVAISGTTTTENSVSGNTIDRNGFGVWIQNAPGNLVGADDEGEGNFISRNDSAGIYIYGQPATGNTIVGNTIGIRDDGDGGTIAEPNGIGIHLFNTADNTIGGTSLAARNWIAGNSGDGILIDRQDQYFGLGQFDSFETTVENPTVSQAAFTAAQTGEGAPFTTLFTSGQTITLDFTGAFEPGSPSLYFKLWGLNTLQAGQQVASLTFDGVAQDATQFDASQVGPGREQYTYFNVDPALLTDGHLTVSLKLGTLPASQKVGIDYAELSIYKHTDNVIVGNTIGGADDRDFSLNNGGAGIHLTSTDGVTIGDGTAAGANLISGNTGPGLHLQYGSGASVRGNVIGSTSTLAVHATNATGVLIEGSYSNSLGGSAPGDRNVISGNLGDGVLINSGASSNQLINNAIGTDFTGLSARPNGDHGVSVVDASYNFIGNVADLGNVISGNRGSGVSISGPYAQGNQIFENRIGTNAPGTGFLANGQSGVRFQNGAFNNHVGSGAPAEGNTISGNDGDGVSIYDADENVIDGNYIGTTGDGLAALGNDGTGVVIVGEANTVQNNVISANGAAGVRLTNVFPVIGMFDGAPIAGDLSEPIYAQFNVIRGNLIGLDASADDENPLPNADGVIFTNGASDNRVGGTGSGDGNHIAYNGLPPIGYFGGAENGNIILRPTGDGVRVEVGSVHNAILGNSIHDNTGYGIRLVDDVALAGGNNDQVAPTQTAALIKNGTMIFKGNFTSTPNTIFRIEMFVADAIDVARADSEGETYLGFFEVTTDNTGFVNYRKTLPTAVPAGAFITATATARVGELGTTDTSQFAAAIKAVPTIEIGDAVIVEGSSGDKQLNFLVSLGANPENGTASVVYATGDFSADARSATANVDYAVITGTTLNVVVSDPRTDTFTRQVSVTIHGDTAPEARERFKVLLSDASGVGFDDGGEVGVGTILDDDQHTFAVGSGSGSKVQIFNSVTGSLLREFSAFEARYNGGARVATGDVTGDGINDIIVGTGTGGGGRVRVFDGADPSPTPSPIFELRPFGSSYRGAVNVAAGDVNGDGLAELIASTGAGSASEVRVIDLDAKGGPALLTKFKAFSKVSNGVRVASGDLDGDGLADIIATNGLNSEVRTFHGDGTGFTGAIGKFKAFSKVARGGIVATAGDLDGDGRDDLIFGVATSSSEVRSFLTSSFTGVPVRTFNPFTGLNGLRLSITDVNSDGIADIVAAQGPGGGNSVRLFNGGNNFELLKITGVPAGGVFVG